MVKNNIKYLQVPRRLDKVFKNTQKIHNYVG